MSVQATGGMESGDDYIGKCGEPGCGCSALNGAIHQQDAHDEHLFLESLNDIARYLVKDGAPYMRQGPADEDYAGLLALIWESMCAMRGRTSEGFSARTKEERYLQAAKCGTSKRRKAIPASVRLEVYKRDSYGCVSCGAHSELTLDHVVPLARGGGNEIENLQTMCASCNSRKGVKPWQLGGSQYSQRTNTPSCRTNGPETDV